MRSASPGSSRTNFQRATFLIFIADPVGRPPEPVEPFFRRGRMGGGTRVRPLWGCSSSPKGPIHASRAPNEASWQCRPSPIDPAPSAPPAPRNRPRKIPTPSRPLSDMVEKIGLWRAPGVAEEPVTGAIRRADEWPNFRDPSEPDRTLLRAPVIF